MGFFSWKCAVSSESVANRYSGKPKEQTECYLITPNNVYYEDNYEGYGEFGGVDVYELLGDGNRNLGIDREYRQAEDGSTLPFEIKIVLAKHYNGQKYEDLEKSDICDCQGYFYD